MMRTTGARPQMREGKNTRQAASAGRKRREYQDLSEANEDVCTACKLCAASTNGPNPTHHCRRKSAVIERCVWHYQIQAAPARCRSAHGRQGGEVGGV